MRQKLAAALIGLTAAGGIAAAVPAVAVAAAPAAAVASGHAQPGIFYRG